MPMQVWPGAPSIFPWKMKSNKEVSHEQLILEIHPCRVRECDLRKPRRRTPEPQYGQRAAVGQSSQGSQTPMLCGYELWPGHQVPDPVGRRHGHRLRADISYAGGAPERRIRGTRNGRGGKMRVIHQSVRILTPQDGAEALRAIEYAGRNCYASQDWITESSAPEFVRSLIRRGHLSPVEFADMTVE